MLIDSHCHLNHLNLDTYAGDLSLALTTARLAGVQGFLTVSISFADVPAMADIANQHPDVYYSVGLHPTEQPGYVLDYDELMNLAAAKKVIAIGETGLDYFRNSGDMHWQQERFRQHIQAAIQLQKPLIIHTRAAAEDTLAIMREEQAQQAGGVMHCFTESWDVAEQAMDLGFYISFSGIVTFANAKELQAVARRVPLDKILVETDSPYLAPVPYRGKPNEPAYVREVAAYLAQLKGLSYEELVQQTGANFLRLFKFSS